MTRLSALADTLAEIPAPDHTGPGLRPSWLAAGAMVSMRKGSTPGKTEGDGLAPADNPYDLQIEAARAVQRYVIGLLVTVAGEALQGLGNALRFGLDAGAAASVETVRECLVRDLGEVLAAVEFACMHGQFDRAGIEAARDRKLARLCDPANRDHLGRPLAPQPIALGGAVLPCRIEGWSKGDGTLGLTVTDNGALYGFDLDAAVAGHLVHACLDAFPQLATMLPQPAAPRTTLVTAGRDASLVTFVFDRDGTPFDLQLDWENARAMRNAIDSQFPNSGR